MPTDRSIQRDWMVNAAPTSARPRYRLSEVWRSRELIFFFAQRDLKVRYKQATLGAAWAILQPLLGAVMFTILFSGLAGIEVKERSYFAFALTGFIAWSYFSTAVTSSTNSLLSNRDLLTKTSFPRIVLPAAALLPAVVDLAVGIALAVVVSFSMGDGLSLRNFALGLPLGLILLLTAVAGPALYFSATVVTYRDVTALVGIALQFVLFLSPIAYPPDLVPERWQTLYFANPLAGALGLLRGALVNAEMPSVGKVLLSCAVAMVGFAVGLRHFRTKERSFADII